MEELNCFIAVQQFKKHSLVTIVAPVWGYGSRMKTNIECTQSESYLQAVYDLLAGLSHVPTLIQKYQKINVYISDLKTFSWLVADTAPTFKLEKSHRMLDEMFDIKTIYKVPYAVKFLSSTQNMAFSPMNLIPFKTLTQEEKDTIVDALYNIKS